MKTYSLVILCLPIFTALAGPILNTSENPTIFTETEASTNSFQTTESGLTSLGKLTHDENQILQETCGKSGRSSSNFVQKSSGSEYALRKESPWVVAVSLSLDFENGTVVMIPTCSGTLISPRHVLAAKHCQALYGFAINLFRFVFDDDCSSSMYTSQNCSIEGAIVRKAVKAFTEEGPSRPPGLQDLIVFELDKPVPITNNVYPACLSGSLPENNDVLRLFAFGDDGLPTVDSKRGSLQKINVNVLPCIDREDVKISLDAFCTNSNHHITLKGDSGGGFISINEDERHSVVGVVSGQWPITPNYKQDIHTAVAPHLSWICEHAGICVPTKVTQLNPKIDVLHL